MAFSTYPRSVKPHLTEGTPRRYAVFVHSSAMQKDTDIGGPGGRFPTTHGSAIVGVGSADSGERQRSFDTLVAAYWKPVYKYIRIRWHKSNEDAKDLTQGFFVQVMEKDYLRPYDPARARFRTFLRTCLEGFLSNRSAGLAWSSRLHHPGTRVCVRQRFTAGTAPRRRKKKGDKAYGK